MSAILKSIAKRVPGVSGAIRRLRQYVNDSKFPGSAVYWQCRYSEGGSSGPGSYGKLAEFKASVLNQFVSDRQIKSVIEFGCGDGNQLLLAKYPHYIGFDVAPAAVQLCAEKFKGDPTKSFFLYDPECFLDGAGVFRADLTISLDVIFHLVEDPVFERYMELLFCCSIRFVVIYSSNFDQVTSSPHERERKFTDYVAAHFPRWSLVEKIENQYPMSKYPAALGSLCDFYIYERRNKK